MIKTDLKIVLPREITSKVCWLNGACLQIFGDVVHIGVKCFQSFGTFPDSRAWDKNVPVQDITQSRKSLQEDLSE